jgi:hypothetical protein
MPEVKLWQAVALSMNIDPDSLKHHPQAWMAGPGAGPIFTEDSYPSREERDRADKRLRLLVANKTVKNGFSPGTLSMDNPANHGVRLSEFAAWAISVGMTPLPDELVALTHAQDRQQSETTANDKVTCDCAELALNGYQINWDYWRGRKQITPQQAAELAHCFEPDKGKVTKELSICIQRLAESLAEHSPTWTLSALVRHLGEDAPFNMKQAVASGNNIAPAKVGAGDTATEDEQPEPVTDSRPSGEDADAQIALLFDPVTVAALEKMFPADGKWAGWAEHASRNEGLKAARTGRGRFNPYLAGIWFAGKGIKGWDLAFCRRRLGNNLPARSRDSKHLLTGELD